VSGYLTPEGQAFWAWSDDGQAIVWTGADGKAAATIAFGAEAAQVLARLAPRGLPSFQAVVLLLAACREGWLESADVAFARAVAAREDEQLVPVLAQALEALLRVSELPAALRTGPAAKAALVEVVLERAPVLAAVSAAEVLEELEAGVVLKPGGPPLLSWLFRDLETLRDGLLALDPATLRERLLLRQRTGLDAAPGAAPVEVEDDEPQASRTSRLIDALVTDPELGALARLARDLRAAVHVPRAVAQEDELPLGGVSDITNRGPLDRLLVSELAHDDETFTVRVAMGEALYLRREAPPRGPEGGRALLVDSGVRLWGVGRVFATAVALAAVATAGRRTRIEAFTARKGALAPLDLGTREGLVAHLEALDPAPHPGPVLPAFLEQAAQGDRVLVTHEDALDDPELQRALRAALSGSGAAPLLVATVARDGTYRLRSVSARGQKALSTARLDLRALLEPAKPTSPASPPLAGDARLPAFLRWDPLPLRLPYPFDYERARHHPEHGVVALTRDGRLLAFPPPLGHTGSIQLTDDVAPAPLHWLEVDDAGVASALVVRPGPGEASLIRVDVRGGGVEAHFVIDADVARARAVVRRGGVLLLVYHQHVDALSLESGRRLHRLELPPGTRWHMGRFFADASGWFALAADGPRPVLEPLPGFPRHALAVFDRAGHEDPWALEPDGVVLSGVGSVTKVERLLEGTATYREVVAISRDGHRLLLNALEGTRYTSELLDLLTGKRRRVTAAALAPGERNALLEPEVQRALVGAPQLRTRLQSLAVDAQGRLTLVSRKGRLHALRERDGWLFLGPVGPGDGRLRGLRSFEPRAGYAGAAWSFGQATWPDGSRAYLDGRGLLHLVPAQGVEVSLVLAERALAAWTTAGEVAGPAYFTGGEDRGGPGQEALTRSVLAHVTRFCEGIR
jgi:hypothetical protein